MLIKSLWLHNNLSVKTGEPPYQTITLLVEKIEYPWKPGRSEKPV